LTFDETGTVPDSQELTISILFSVFYLAKIIAANSC
jgi:hypothetical protein